MSANYPYRYAPTGPIPRPAYLPPLKVDVPSADTRAIALMWAHADGATALMAINVALCGRNGIWARPDALRRAAKLLRIAADHVDRAVEGSVIGSSP